MGCHMSTLKVAIYARVSSPERKTKGPTSSDPRQNPEVQLVPLRELCQRKGWGIVGEYVDRESGRKGKVRPEFNRMLEDAQLATFQILLVWKLDRLSRSMVDFSNTLQELHKQDIRFISATQSIDTDKSDPASRLLINVMAAFAEFESELISERVKAGIAARKARGLPVGKQRRVMDGEKLMKLKETGASIRQIARIMGQKRSTVGRRLKELELAYRLKDRGKRADREVENV